MVYAVLRGELKLPVKSFLAGVRGATVQTAPTSQLFPYLPSVPQTSRAIINALHNNAGLPDFICLTPQTTTRKLPTAATCHVTWDTFVNGGIAFSVLLCPSSGIFGDNKFEGAFCVRVYHFLNCVYLGPLRNDRCTWEKMQRLMDARLKIFAG